ncbi:MAG: NUDIX domain-containing protein [Clostridiales bacterium]|nr:NUDIX domain-containing protein [Clostridiales bacterium]
MGQIVVAVKGLATRDGRLLLIRRAPDQPGPHVWEGVGGKVEFGEQLCDALRREFREEVGLSVEVGPLLYASTRVFSAELQLVVLVYACVAGDGDIRLSFEHVDARWVDAAEARTLLPEDILSEIEQSRAFEALGLG